ncbi:MAG: alpha/beta hydrolase [Proteobacteria bacterium]|nr:alpha/beta hydrolase [Pseudomonadota bacterium]
MPPVELAWDSIGTGPTVLLLMGIGAQRVLWPEPLMQRIADRGFRVVRCDNRDCGESPRAEEPAPSLAPMIGRMLLGRRVNAPYTVSDMAGDAIALLDKLDAPGAHVVGASMGGMIAQTIAIEHPERVHSLTSIMSTTSSRKLGTPGLRALASLFGPAPKSAADYRAKLLKLQNSLGSGRFAIDPERALEVSEVVWERGISTDGFIRQFAAILASGSRSHGLRGVTAPTLILHGAQDPLFPPRFARAQAEAIPNAELYFVDGMGHDLPRPLWPEIADRILEHIKGAEAA